MEIKIIYRNFFLIILVQTCYSVTRKLHLIEVHNDKDPAICKNYVPLNLVIADGPEDSIFYLWSFVYNPSVFVALTHPATNVTIKWAEDLSTSPDESQYNPDVEKCNPESVEFSPERPFFSYGLSIQKIIEFNDTYNSGNMNAYRSESINVLNPRYFKWHLIRKKVEKNEFVEFELVADSYFDPVTKIRRKGNIRLLVSVFGTVDRFIQKPSMLHSANSTQIDLTIDKFETNSTFANSRFAIEVLLVSEGNPNSTFNVDSSKKNIDDEHTPGVFKVVEVKSPQMKLAHRDENVGMYLEWRPISYTTEERDVTDSAEVNNYPLQTSRDPYSDAFWSILFSYYSSPSQNILKEIILQKMNVSFGAADDPFYKKSGYTSWTFLLGYSHSLDEQITSSTILIVSVIIAVPLLPLIFYGSFLMYRRILRTGIAFRRT